MDTYNSFIDNVNDNFASLHLQIERFEAGFYDDLGPFSTEDQEWPIMWIVPTEVTFLQNSVSSYSLRTYFLDLLEQDNSNERDVLSDQLSIARDFTNWLRENESNGFNLLNDPRVIPVKSVLMDYTAGWYVDMDIEVNTEGSDCSIPFSSGATASPVACDPVTVTNSDGSYNVTVLSGGSLTLPDSTAQSSLGTFSVTFPSVSAYTIPDVDWTDSDGATYSTEYSNPIVCTPVASLVDPPSFSDPLFLYRGDAGQTLVDGLLDAWADQSGNGYDVAASTSAKRQKLNMNSGAFGFRDVNTGGADGFRATGLPTTVMTNYAFDFVIQTNAAHNPYTYGPMWGNVNGYYPLFTSFGNFLNFNIKSSTGGTTVKIQYNTSVIPLILYQPLKLTINVDLTAVAFTDKFKLYKDGVYVPPYRISGIWPYNADVWPTDVNNSNAQFNIISTSTARNSAFPLGYVAAWERNLTLQEITENNDWKNQIWA